MTTAPDHWRRFHIDSDTKDIAFMATSNVLTLLPTRQYAVEEDARQHGAGGLVEIVILDARTGSERIWVREIGIMLRRSPDREDEAWDRSASTAPPRSKSR